MPIHRDRARRGRWSSDVAIGATIPALPRNIQLKRSVEAVDLDGYVLKTAEIVWIRARSAIRV